MLLANKNYTPEVVELSRKISSNVSQCFNNWLVNSSYKINHDLVDSLLSLENRYCDDVIFKESERITNNQRILLRCEQDRVAAKREKIAAKQNTLRYVLEDICETASVMLEKKLETTLISSLFSQLPDYNHFASIAYSPSLNFNKLNQIALENRGLSSSLTDFVSNRQFCEKYGRKPKVILDPKVAVGLIGIDNCRLLFPILMSQSLLKWSDENTKDISPKLWQHLVVTANATRIRLQDTSVREPDVGVLLGTLRVIPMFLVCNHFSQTFEDALVQTMLSYREASDRHNEYYACAEVLPDTSFLEKIFSSMEKRLLSKLIEHIDWSPNTAYIKQALVEEVDGVDVSERSVYGAALAQAHAFSIFEALNNSELFNLKHRPYWFSQVQMSGLAIAQMKSRVPGQLTDSM
ncbi:hypothetical protein LZI70_00205 [Vibrio pelagius]|uniref:HDOD domain-containing protein n=1 Tax=Vibrio pelagius TaxID=28169 RepID=A0ABY5G4G9_VIBPE|nr:hypothetical protein [Vibrio pelagius]UTT84762.1 hypothetical protein LZI70_00205 [Vibrio pelagius]